MIQPSSRFRLVKTVLLGVLVLLVPFATSAQQEPFKTEYHPAGSHIYFLVDGGSPLCLTGDLPGYNVAPRLFHGDNTLWATWEIIREGQAGIGVYDFFLQRAQVYMLKGIKDIGQIEVLIKGDTLKDLYFIAKSEYVDVYHYRPDTLALVNLTVNPEIEHRIRLSGQGDLTKIEVERIDSIVNLRYDSLSQQVHKRSIHQKKRSETVKKLGPVSNAQGEALDDYFLAFGDSITAGKMYLPQEGDTVLTGGLVRPQYAYSTQIEELLIEDGYDVAFNNSGILENTTELGRERIESMLDSDNYSTLMTMLGTNDVYRHTMILEQSVENMEFIVDAALDREMRVLLCTIPPRNDWLDVASFYNTIALNEELRKLAANKHINLIEVYNNFMDYQKPEGWIELLETRDDKISSGAHPNPQGHAIIAGLMKEKYDNFLLKAPESISRSALTTLNGQKVSWLAPNSKFIDHYVFEFGTESGNYSHEINLAGLEVDFVLLQRFFTASPITGLFQIVERVGQTPQVIFQRGATVYYRIKTVNEKGLESRYSAAGSFTLGSH